MAGVGSAGNFIGSTFMPSFLGPASCSRFAIWRVNSGQAMHVGLPSFGRSAASPENPIAVARKHARPIKYRRPRQGAAGAHERIVLPLKIFVGDGIGLKFYSPISSCHNPSLVARQEGLTCSFAQSSQFFRFPGPLYDVHTNHSCIHCCHCRSICRPYSV